MDHLSDIRERLVRVETQLAGSLENLNRSVGALNATLLRLDDRLRMIETDNAATKVKLGLWGGVAGAISLIWSVITAIWK